MVQSWKDGQVVWEDIYMFGHQENQLVDRSGRLRLTKDHFVVLKGATVLAKDVNVGDVLKMLNGTVFVEVIVEEVNIVHTKGLFNPYTLSGRIVVDGVMASCHSSSALDGLFNFLGVNLV